MYWKQSPDICSKLLILKKQSYEKENRKNRMESELYKGVNLQ
jgi:hypothetical protein